MNESKHGSHELPPANLKSQLWEDLYRETVDRKPQFVVCSKITKPRSFKRSLVSAFVHFNCTSAINTKLRSQSVPFNEVKFIVQIISLFNTLAHCNFQKTKFLFNCNNRLLTIIFRLLYRYINVSFLVIADNKINVTMTIKGDKECSDAKGQYNKSSLLRELSVTVKLQLQYQYGFARRI